MEDPSAETQYGRAKRLGLIIGGAVFVAVLLVFSSHQDHDGVRYGVAGDSIWNGADDNASTSVALLAIARAWVKQPGRRSALFIFHGAEERGLLGSRYHVAHPVVPLDSIVALLAHEFATAGRGWLFTSPSSSSLSHS